MKNKNRKQNKSVKSIVLLIVFTVVFQIPSGAAADSISSQLTGTASTAPYASAISPTVSQQSPSYLSPDYPLSPATLAASTPPMIAPSLTMTAKDLKPLPSQKINGQAFPKATALTPNGASVQVTDVNRGGHMIYDTGSAGWAGSGLTFDDFSTSSIETSDLSKITTLMFGLRGSASTIKLEFVDSQDKKTSVYLTGIRADTEQVWTLSTSQLAGIDLTKIRLIYFIAEGTQLKGSLDFFHYPLGTRLPPASPSSTGITSLPGSISNITIAPSGANSTINGTSRGMTLQYNTGTPGWTGAGFSFDNFATSSVETGDVSGFDYLRFGVKGTAGQLKLKFVDNQNHKAAVYLRNIDTTSEKVWTVLISDLAQYNINLSKIRMVYFIVEGANQTGFLEINRISAPMLPAAIYSPVHLNIPGHPRNISIAPAGATAAVSPSAYGLTLQYTTGAPAGTSKFPAADWAGAGFSFDNPSTTTSVETVDISTFSPLIFGLKGSADIIKFEVVDSQERKASVLLSGLSSSQELVWAVLTTELANYGVNLRKIKTMYFIVEGAHRSGSLEINWMPHVQPAPLPNNYEFSHYVQTGYGQAMPEVYFPLSELFVRVRNVTTGDITYRRVSSFNGYTEIRAASPSGKYILLASANSLYVADNNLDSRSTLISIPSGIKAVSFVSETRAQILLYNGDRYWLDVLTKEFVKIYW